MNFLKPFLVVVVLAFGGAVATPVFAGANDPLFINLSTDNEPLVDHAIHFGGIHLSRGHPLTIFLSGKAVLLASKAQTAKYADQQKALGGLMDKGAQVIVCQYCMKAVGVKESDLLARFKMGSPEVTGDALFKDNSKTISW